MVGVGVGGWRWWGEGGEGVGAGEAGGEACSVRIRVGTAEGGEGLVAGAKADKYVRRGGYTSSNGKCNVHDYFFFLIKRKHVTTLPRTYLHTHAVCQCSSIAFAIQLVC